MTSPCLLALDTATDVCAVALLRGHELVERAETVTNLHSERLIPMAQQLLAEAGVTLAQLDAVAFGAGPGSFTGLRIACGVAQGLAYGIDRPVVPVGNLAALALNVRAAAPQARRIVAAIDARMQEVYWAVFDSDAVDEAALVEVVSPSLSSAADLPAALATLGGSVDTLAGEAWTQFASLLDAVPAARRLPQVRASASAIARLAARALARGEALAPQLAAPVYVRDRVAQTIDERRAAREVVAAAAAGTAA